MKSGLSLYKSYRVYRHLSFFGILNHMICNRIMKSKFLVAMTPALYDVATKFPGKTITNWVLNSTFNTMLTAGNTLADLQERSVPLSRHQIPIIIDFCAEGVLQQPDSEALLDKNAQLFFLSGELAAQTKNHMTSIKITGLLNMGLLKRYNESVLLRDRIWSQYSEEGRISAGSLLQAFQTINRGVTEQDLAQYLRAIHNFSGEDIHHFWLDQIQFKMNHHPYYLYEPSKNSLSITKLLYPLDQLEQKQVLALKRRLDQVLEPQVANTNNYRVLVDAEQSYIQRAIESISQQLQEKYNKQKVYIIPTLQNYLKIAPKRVDFQIQIAKRRHLYLAVKLVRGAYLVEESRLSKQKGYESPIVDSFSKTTDNYLNSFISIITSDLKGQIFAAGHNEQTIRRLIELKKGCVTSIKINFAQLYGLGDHLTHYLLNSKESVYKLLPWAQTDVMIRYIIRRAEQLSQMQYPLDIQHSLLSHELFCRLFPI